MDDVQKPEKVSKSKGYASSSDETVSDVKENSYVDSPMSCIASDGDTETVNGSENESNAKKITKDKTQNHLFSVDQIISASDQSDKEKNTKEDNVEVDESSDEILINIEEESDGIVVEEVPETNKQIKQNTSKTTKIQTRTRTKRKPKAKSKKKKNTTPKSKKTETIPEIITITSDTEEEHKENAPPEKRVTRNDQKRRNRVSIQKKRLKRTRETLYSDTDSESEQEPQKKKQPSPKKKKSLSKKNNDKKKGKETHKKDDDDEILMEDDTIVDSKKSTEEERNNIGELSEFLVEFDSDFEKDIIVKKPQTKERSKKKSKEETKKNKKKERKSIETDNSDDEEPDLESILSLVPDEGISEKKSTKKNKPQKKKSKKPEPKQPKENNTKNKSTKEKKSKKKDNETTKPKAHKQGKKEESKTLHDDDMSLFNLLENIPDYTTKKKDIKPKSTETEKQNKSKVVDSIDEGDEAIKQSYISELEEMLSDSHSGNEGKQSNSQQVKQTKNIQKKGKSSPQVPENPLEQDIALENILVENNEDIINGLTISANRKISESQDISELLIRPRNISYHKIDDKNLSKIVKIEITPTKTIKVSYGDLKRFIKTPNHGKKLIILMNWLGYNEYIYGFDEEDKQIKEQDMEDMIQFVKESYEHGTSKELTNEEVLNEFKASLKQLRTSLEKN